MPPQPVAQTWECQCCPPRHLTGPARCPVRRSSEGTGSVSRYRQTGSPHSWAAAEYLRSRGLRALPRAKQGLGGAAAWQGVPLTLLGAPARAGGGVVGPGGELGAGSWAQRGPFARGQELLQLGRQTPPRCAPCRAPATRRPLLCPVALVRGKADIGQAPFGRGGGTPQPGRQRVWGCRKKWGADNKWFSWPPLGPLTVGAAREAEAAALHQAGGRRVVPQAASSPGGLALQAGTRHWACSVTCGEGTKGRY